MSEAILSGRGITKRFEQGKLSVDVLRGIDFDVQRGETVAIIGASGSGKSTLLQVLGGLEVPTNGSVTVMGEALAGLDEKRRGELRNRKLGFVYQFHHLLPEFTALENVCIPGFIRNTPAEQVKKRAEELLHYLGLSDRITHKPTELSGGEQQRVAVARALINQPDIIFADEPTGNLDSMASQDLHRLIRQLRNDYGQAFVIVTHNKELAELSDRCLEMKDGLLI